MKRIISNILFLLILFFLFKWDLQAKYFFYEISTDSSKAYIFGSIHFGKPEWYPFEKYIEDAFANSDVLVTEVDMNSVSQFTFINRMFATDTIDLKYKLKPENYQKLVSKLGKLGLSESMIQRIRPWFIAFSLQRTEMQQGNINSKDGVDLYFNRKANELNKEIIGIEEIDFQLGLLEKFDCCADEIIERLDNNEETEEYLNNLINNWIEGNDQKINELINEISNKNEASQEYLKVFHEILFRRNESMALSIKKLLKNRKQYFIVIGAAHLVGENSIIKYLEKNKNKYKIKRL